VKYEKYRQNINGVLKAPFEEARSRRIGQNPAVSQSDVPNPGVGIAAVESVAAAGPDLQIFAVVRCRTCLCASGFRRRHEQKRKKGQGERQFNSEISSMMQVREMRRFWKQTQYIRFMLSVKFVITGPVTNQ